MLAGNAAICETWLPELLGGFTSPQLRHEDPMTATHYRAGLQPRRPGRQAGCGKGTCLGAVVCLPGPPQKIKGIDAAQRRPRRSRHGIVDRFVRGGGRACLLFLAELVRPAVFHRLRSSLRIVLRLAMARMRPSHRLQDRVDERRDLQHRVFHDHARADRLAMEPHPSSHRYDHRRPRSGNRSDAADRHPQSHFNVLRRAADIGGDQEHGSPFRRAPKRRGSDFHSRKRAQQGLPDGAHMARRFIWP